MCKSFIFLQAPLKISAVLNCYEAEKAKGHEVSIIIPSYLNNMKLFIDNLHLKAHVVLFEGFRWKHALLYSFIYRKHLKRKLTQIGVNDNSLFFFTDVNEGNIGLLLPFLKKCNPTQILSIQDLYDIADYQQTHISSNIKRRIKAKLLSFFYNTHFIAASEGGSEELWTDSKAYHFPIIDYSDTSIINKYRIKVTDAPNCVVFYTNEYYNRLYEDNDYDKMNIEIINILHQKGYKVLVKNHPMQGTPNFVNDLADEIIPSYIPGEYIELTSFNFAIGFFSTALATASEIIPTYSVLNVWNVKNAKFRDEFIQYLKNFKNSNVIFLNTLEEIPCIL